MRNFNMAYRFYLHPRIPGPVGITITITTNPRTLLKFLIMFLIALIAFASTLAILHLFLTPPHEPPSPYHYNYYPPERP